MNVVCSSFISVGEFCQDASCCQVLGQLASDYKYVFYNAVEFTFQHMQRGYICSVTYKEHILLCNLCLEEIYVSSCAWNWSVALCLVQGWEYVELITFVFPWGKLLRHNIPVHCFVLKRVTIQSNFACVCPKLNLCMQSRLKLKNLIISYTQVFLQLIISQLVLLLLNVLAKNYSRNVSER